MSYPCGPFVRARAAAVCHLAWLFSLAALAPAQSTSRPAVDPDVARWIEAALGPDEAAAELAGQKLVDRFVAPVEAALGAVSTRPADEQLRARRLLHRLHAVLRVRLARAELPEADRALLDAFLARNPTLVERLFDDDPRIRLDAVHQIPLSENSGAGVLVVKKVDDPDAEVAEAAFDVAAELGDRVVARGLARYADDAVAALKGNVYGPREQDIATVVALFAGRCVKMIGDIGDKETLPSAVDALRWLVRSPYREAIEIEPILSSLCKFQDERIVSLLLDLLDDNRLVRTTPDPAGRVAVQTVSDTALVNLLRIYGLDADAVHLFRSETPPGFAGFFSEEERAIATRTFRRWHRENAEKPREQRGALTTQPAR